VVRIKGRRRDRGGEGGRSKSAGWEDQPPFFNLCNANTSKVCATFIFPFLFFYYFGCICQTMIIFSPS